MLANARLNCRTFAHPSVTVVAWKQSWVADGKHKLMRSTSDVQRKEATVLRPRVLRSTVPAEFERMPEARAPSTPSLPPQAGSLYTGLLCPGNIYIETYGERMHSSPGAESDAVAKD
jgi:hypothetical protein